MLIASLLTFLTPIAAQFGLYCIVAIRIVIGFLHGTAFPSMQGAWSHWAPPKESSKLASFHIAGCSVGTVIIFPLSGIIAEQLGWRWIFYFTGLSSLLWSLAWFGLVYDSPKTHPRISQSERHHIVSSIEEEKGVKIKTSTPWRKMLLCPAVWAVSAAHASSNWGNYQLNSMMPLYMDNILRFNHIKSFLGFHHFRIK